MVGTLFVLRVIRLCPPVCLFIVYCSTRESFFQRAEKYVFVVLGLRCLLDCHVLKGFGIYMIGILDRLY